MLFGAKMVLCALAGLSASLRSAANLPAAGQNFIFAPHNIIYYYNYFEIDHLGEKVNLKQIK
jgi:hypothetical protein